jgi:hypothetical protein
MPAFEDQVQAPEQQGVASGPGEGSQGGEGGVEGEVF